MPTTRTEGDLPDSCFAYVPDGPRSDRKLRLCSLETGELDAGIVGAAAAALGPGYRGQKVSLPSDAVGPAKRKVRSAWKKLHPDSSEDDMPSGIKLSEIALCEMGMGMGHPGLPKSDDRVNYRDATADTEENCYHCRFWQYGSCALVEGGIEADDVCDLFTAPLKTMPAAMFAVHPDGDAAHWKFVQPIPAEFATPPEWSPFLPVPGRYDHPVYGELDYSPEAYDRFIANFKSGTYQASIPVNAEHDVQASGAVGWITDMRLADDGAIDVKVEWNERGKALIEDDRFRYVSAEVYDVWTDPVSGAQVPNVAVGMAICTNPYFKESVLRPLAASEAVITRVAASARREAPATGTGVPRETSMGEKEETPTQTTTQPPGTDDAVKQLTERILAELGGGTRISDPVVEQFVAKAAAELHDAQTKARQEAERAKTLTEQNALLQAQNRVKTFTDEVMGRSTENGIAYAGHIPDMVRMLCSLANAYGDASWEVGHYKELNRAHAEQIKAGSLFKEIGTSRGADATQSAQDQIDALARELVAANPKLTHAQAFTQVLNSNAELRAAHARERQEGR